MDEKRIKIAEDNFRRYIKEGKIKKVSPLLPIVYQTYLKNARESLNVANKLSQDKTSSLWVVVTSYYSMFYIACAYLYKLGYKAGDDRVHQVINEALISQGRNKINNYLLENYNEEKEKALVIVDNYLDNYGKEKAKRASFQYETTDKIKEAKADTSLKRAKEFLTLIEEVLNKEYPSD
jgi:uncharacterized protein (UPF0332 family)